MKKEEKEWFEKGRAYEREFAKQAADERSESMMICLLERIMHGGPGEIRIPKLDIMLAKRRHVVFQTREDATDDVRILLKEEPH